MEIFINELSSGVYEVVARDATGPRFRTIGAYPETLIETARARYAKIVRGISRPATICGYTAYVWIGRRVA
jgi:hypothetical protein